MSAISYRPLLGVRVWCTAFCGGVSVWVVAANTADYASGRAGAGVFVPVTAVVLILVGLAWRFVGQYFRADGDGLVVRNIFRTYRVPVAQVIGFEIGSRFVIGKNRTRVTTASGIITIGAFGPRPNFLHGDLIAFADELDDWLEDTRAALS